MLVSFIRLLLTFLIIGASLSFPLLNTSYLYDNPLFPSYTGLTVFEMTHCVARTLLIGFLDFWNTESTSDEGGLIFQAFDISDLSNPMEILRGSSEMVSSSAVSSSSFQWKVSVDGCFFVMAASWKESSLLRHRVTVFQLLSEGETFTARRVGTLGPGNLSAVVCRPGDTHLSGGSKDRCVPSQIVRIFNTSTTAPNSSLTYRILYRGSEHNPFAEDDHWEWVDRPGALVQILVLTSNDSLLLDWTTPLLDSLPFDVVNENFYHSQFHFVPGGQYWMLLDVCSLHLSANTPEDPRSSSLVRVFEFSPINSTLPFDTWQIFTRSRVSVEVRDFIPVSTTRLYSAWTFSLYDRNATLDEMRHSVKYYSRSFVALNFRYDSREDVLTVFRNSFDSIFDGLGYVGVTRGLVSEGVLEPVFNSSVYPVPSMTIGFADSDQNVVIMLVPTGSSMMIGDVTYFVRDYVGYSLVALPFDYVPPGPVVVPPSMEAIGSVVGSAMGVALLIVMLVLLGGYGAVCVFGEHTARYKLNRYCEFLSATPGALWATLFHQLLPLVSIFTWSLSFFLAWMSSCESGSCRSTPWELNVSAVGSIVFGSVSAVCCLVTLIFSLSFAYQRSKERDDEKGPLKGILYDWIRPGLSAAFLSMSLSLFSLTTLVVFFIELTDTARYIVSFALGTFALAGLILSPSAVLWRHRSFRSFLESFPLDNGAVGLLAILRLIAMVFVWIGGVSASLVFLWKDINVRQSGRTSSRWAMAPVCIVYTVVIWTTSVPVTLLSSWFCIERIMNFSEENSTSKKVLFVLGAYVCPIACYPFCGCGILVALVAFWRSFLENDEDWLVPGTAIAPDSTKRALLHFYLAIVAPVPVVLFLLLFWTRSGYILLVFGIFGLIFFVHHGVVVALSQVRWFNDFSLPEDERRRIQLQRQEQRRKKREDKARRREKHLRRQESAALKKREEERTRALQETPLDVPDDLALDLSLLTIMDEDEPLGSGSFGLVYRGSYKLTEMKALPVAVKKGLYRENMREIRVAIDTIGAKHENVLQTIAFAKDNDFLYIMMELCEDGTVMNWLKGLRSRGELTDEIKLKTIMQLSRGIHHLHSIGLIHRDLKPENLLIKDGIVKVCDFGLSSHATSMSSVIGKGTLGYMPSREYSVFSLEDKQRVDVYAFGIICYELWSLQRAYTDLLDSLPKTANTFELLDAIHKEDRKPALDGPECAHMPPDLKLLVRRCWAHHPRDRPLFEEIVERLQAIVLGDRPGEVIPGSLEAEQVVEAALAEQIVVEVIEVEVTDDPGIESDN